jgi:hypothetical protein
MGGAYPADRVFDSIGASPIAGDVPGRGRGKAAPRWKMDRPAGRAGDPPRRPVSPEEAPQIRTARKRRALAITETELRAIAAAANMGDSKIPKNGYRSPAPMGMPRAL